MVCVIGGVTYQVPFIDLQSTVSVPATRMINTGGGLQGGGNLSADRTLSIATAGVTTDKIATTGVVAGTYGSGTEIPVVTVNAQGQVTNVTTASLVISGYVPDTRQIIAGTGLSGGGNLQANRTLSVNFSNATPLAVGSATSGTAVEAARGDHRERAVPEGVATAGVAQREETAAVPVDAVVRQRDGNQRLHGLHEADAVTVVSLSASERVK